MEVAKGPSPWLPSRDSVYHALAAPQALRARTSTPSLPAMMQTSTMSRKKPCSTTPVMAEMASAAAEKMESAALSGMLSSGYA